MRSHVLFFWLQALNSFIAPIPGFEGDIPIPAILVLARPPGDESTNNPFAGASANSYKTQAGKRKAAPNPTPQKKAKKTAGKSPGGIKINEPAPKAPTPTPALDSRVRIPIH
jgi:hypothetical protein